MNFFKKSTQVATNVISNVNLSFEAQRDPQIIIAEIHESFDSAADRLLAEAKQILENLPEVSKGERLKNIGFIRAEKAVEAQSVLIEREQRKYISEMVEYCQSAYPNNKYITQQEVERICKKYGLLFGDTEYYISDVPEKNLSEIEAFKLNDKEKMAYKCGWFVRNSEHRYWQRLNEKTPEAKWGYLKFSGRENYLVDTSEDIMEHREPAAMRICASVKDFDTKNMKITDGYKLELNLPDPIVLQPLFNVLPDGHNYCSGYLIVSKWGLEANDGSLVNEKMN